jgi:prevent-host-death family protein
MCYMKVRKRVGVRELRQNLSVHLRRVARGETLEVTDHGLSVALLTPLPPAQTALERLVQEGKATAARGDLLALGVPPGRISRRGTAALEHDRTDRL